MPTTKKKSAVAKKPASKKPAPKKPAAKKAAAKKPASKKPAARKKAETRPARPKASELIADYTGRVRNAYVPVVAKGDGALSDSKFGGKPWLAEGEKWPSCPKCKQPMKLFVQLDLASLPPDAAVGKRDGLLQFFSCTNASSECDAADAYEPFSRFTLVRVARTVGKAAAVTLPKGAFPAKRITRWKAVREWPGSGEVEALGLGYEEIYQHITQLGDARCNYGEKLSGWPMWVQSPEYPSCPKCKKPMEYVFQVDSDGNLPHAFGDAGVGHITRCLRHPDVLAFAWACT